MGDASRHAHSAATSRTPRGAQAGTRAGPQAGGTAASGSAAAATVHSATESAEPLTVDLGWRKRAPPSPMRTVTS